MHSRESPSVSPPRPGSMLDIRNHERQADPIGIFGSGK